MSNASLSDGFSDLRLSAGPQYQSQVEFTITNVVSWDLTSVEGVSGGITMNYTDADDDETDVVAIPAKFEGDAEKRRETHL